ncbi:MAG TPA: four helix bundle protein, partial [Gemmatimonadaceae bacterium]|nr:four helix bundle protein [Gemmatimonadaceae bacterium]
MPSSMGDFKKLRVWQEARELTKGVFSVAENIRGVTGPILRNQLCRAVLSIPANIAEGSAKSGDREFARFLKIARGSLAEVESHLIIAVDIGAIREEEQQPLLEKVGNVSKMLNGFLERILLSAEVLERARVPRKSSRTQNSRSAHPVLKAPSG